MALLLVIAVNFISALFQACSGFGYAMLAMALMPQFLPMPVCSAVSAVTVVCIGIQMTVSLRRHLQWKTILLPVAAAITTIPVGIWCLMHFEERTLRWVLAILMIVVTLILACSRAGWIRVPGRWYSAVILGWITGLSTGMFNIVGPFFMLYYIHVCDDTMSMKACLESSFLVAGLYSMSLHLYYGTINWTVLPLLIGSGAAAVIAGLLGLRLYRHMDKTKIARVAYVLFPIMAVSLLIS
mgnify:CR=1 FL=1